MSWDQYVGLVGVTVVLTAGKVFEPVREWLLGFRVRSNPLRIVGELLACSMCCGWWVGFLWGYGLRGMAVADAVIAGGLVGLASYATDTALGFVSAYSGKALADMRAASMAMVERARRPSKQEASRDDDEG